METLTGLAAFFSENAATFFEIAFATISVASLITALTPTPADDVFVGKVYRVVEWLALNVGHAKEPPPNQRGADEAVKAPA